MLPTIHMPTLVLHRADNSYVVAGNGRYLAEHIDGARYVEIDGADHFFHAGDPELSLGPVLEFLTGRRVVPEPERGLARVRCSDIVGATAPAGRVGDAAWRELLARHHAIVRNELAHFGGREVDTAGDGFFASFEGPARGVRCAMAVRDGLRSLGIEIRAGLHTGECEWSGDKLAGIAVHVGARVAGLAEAGEVLVSRTVKDLVAGSLALGADRWQTVVRVVLPTASPGIFSATMVGFGRAIGETMIVLMATGNTPIMDWNLFNGFRTLSANIAVEIPEAPVGSTLYRTLFVAAILLFAVTFVINTVAELVRQRLRTRYARL